MAAPIFLIGGLVSAGASIMGGISANNAAKAESRFLGEQGRIAQEEANREAELHRRDVRRFGQTQSLSFLKNGVTLAGSPLLTIEDTMTTGEEEAQSIERSGAAQRTLYNQRGAIVRNQGRSALIGGFGQAAGTATSVYATGRKAGIF